MTSKDNTDRPKDTCAQFVVKSFRRAQEHPMGRQYYAGSSPLNFGGRKRSGAFGEIWLSATNVQSAGI